MRIAEIMTRDVRTVAPDRFVREAARLMDELNVGVLPVCDGERLVGMITDRDITVRATAAGLDPDRTRIFEIMSSGVRWCREDDDVGEVVRHMSDSQIRRLPVVGPDKRLVGIVALGDLAADRAPGADEALRRISSPAEPDRSGTPSTRRADATRDTRPMRLTEAERGELDRRRDARGEDFGGGYGADDYGRAYAADFDDQGGSAEERSSRERDPSDREVMRAARDTGRETGRQTGGFRFREEDDRRAAFAGGFNEAYGEGEGPGQMRGGFGGEGYSGYGVDTRRGAQGGGGGGYGAGFEDHGSRPDGTPYRRGFSGEENYDRGMTGDRPRRNDRSPEAYHRGRGPRSYQRSDERIREEVSERLSDDPQVDASGIEVAVFDREVTLSGTVEHRAAKRRAEDLAHAVAGVTHVQNNLRVQAQGGSLAEQGRAMLGGNATTGTRRTAQDAATTGNPGTTGGVAGMTAGTEPGGRASS